MSETASYVYGVVRPSTVPEISSQGVGGGAVHVIEDGDVAAVVSDVPAGPLTGTKDDVLAHSRVLEEVVASTTVLPMRFGVVLDGEDAVRGDLLGRLREELRDLLAAMEGRVQIRVRAFYVDEAGLKEIVAEQPDIKQLAESVRGTPEDATYYERIRLGEMIAAALEEKRDRDGQEVLAALEPFAADVSTEPVVHEQMVLNASLLIDRDAQGRVGEAVAQVGDRLASRIELRVVGPLPPYSFVDLPDVSREEAWA